MTAQPIYWCNTDNLVGIVTTETDKDDNAILELFCLHYKEFTEDHKRGNLLVGSPTKHVHSK